MKGGYSSREDLCELITLFWDLVLKLQIRVFVDRVTTDANPAGRPFAENLAQGEAVGWLTQRPHALCESFIRRAGDRPVCGGPGTTTGANTFEFLYGINDLLVKSLSRRELPCWLKLDPLGPRLCAFTCAMGPSSLS